MKQFLFYVVALSFFTQSVFSEQESQRKTKKLSRLYNQIEVAMTTEDLVEAANYMRIARQKHVSFESLKKIAKKAKAYPLLKALYATKRMYNLKEYTGLSKDELFSLALFIETEMAQKVVKKGNYLSRSSTKQPRAVEFDPLTGKSFIHLKNHGGVKRLGKGSKKVVTKSILYDFKKPEVVANCETYKAIASEVGVTKALQGTDGLFEVYAITERKGYNDTPIYSFLCKLYRNGTMTAYTKGKNESFKQNLLISHDILKGLYGMHKKGYVHRDLGLANYLVDKKKCPIIKKKRPYAVIADLGRTMTAKEAKGKTAQGHSKYTPPEGILWNKLKPDDYYGTDLYAVGCLFYRLFTGKRAPWMDLNVIKDPARSHVQRYKRFYALHSKFHKKIRTALISKVKKKKKPSVKQRAQILALQMTHPNPSRRISTKAAYKKLCKIIIDAKKGK